MRCGDVRTVCVCVGACVHQERRDPISTTLKVITLIKAVMCEDRRGEGRGGEGRWGGRERAIFYGAS